MSDNNEQIPDDLSPIPQPEGESTIPIPGEGMGDLIGVHLSHSERYRGLFPHPRHMEHWERVLPGSGNRILTTFEGQEKHRRWMEKVNLVFEGVKSLVGIGSALWLVLTVAGYSYDLIKTGHDVAGTFLGTVDLAALSGVFVYGSQLIRRERVEKTKIMADLMQSQEPSEGDEAE